MHKIVCETSAGLVKCEVLSPRTCDEKQREEEAGRAIFSPHPRLLPFGKSSRSPLASANISHHQHRAAMTEQPDSSILDDPAADETPALANAEIEMNPNADEDLFATDDRHKLVCQNMCCILTPTSFQTARCWLLGGEPSTMPTGLLTHPNPARRHQTETDFHCVVSRNFDLQQVL